MKFLVPVLFFSIIVSSCSSNSEQQPKKKSIRVDMPKVEALDKVVVNANQSATLEVEGMVCKMGCAAAIKGELLKTNAVSECNVDFEEDRKINTVKVEFDNQQIDSTKMVELIESINEGQFTVHGVSTKSL